MPIPQALPPNVISHWYTGGPALAAWRGLAPVGERSPEEWIGATVHRFGEPGIGPSRLADGTLLKDAVAEDPIGWLGRDDGEPGDTGILVKLLDAGQRLPVHVHPTREFARRHLGCAYGKTEAWYVLEAVAGAAVWVGWREDVNPARLADLVAAQDVDGLLSLMHRVVVNPGDGIFVPGGTPHAIGAGILLVEAQEPTDQSILLEHINTTATESEIFLGLSPEIALSSVSTTRLHDSEALVRRATVDTGSGPVSVLPADADPYFRMDLLGGDGRSPAFPAGFAVVVVLAGAGRLSAAALDGNPCPLTQGQVWVVPYAAGDWTVDGDARVLACHSGTTWPLDPVGGPR
jgi:mannose-6-phosphate isomerase